jgi:hypothetical protein
VVSKIAPYLVPNLVRERMTHNRNTLTHFFGRLVLLYTEVLALDYNELSGSIPSSISSVTALKSIWLHNNMLTGTLPPLQGLTSLEHINLNKTMLGGSIPADWGKLTRLETLDLSELIGVTGVIPSSFRNLTSLKRCILDLTLIQGTFPEFFGDLVSLEFFSASTVSLNGTLPTTVGLLENLGKTRCCSSYFDV